MKKERRSGKGRELWRYERSAREITGACGAIIMFWRRELESSPV